MHNKFKYSIYIMKNFILGLAVLSSVVMNAQTQIIAHRGFWQTQPTTTENSLKSLENAQKLKLYGSEFDVRMTKDGVLVINHDEHHGKMEISETDFKELETLKLSNGENFPTLKEYLKQGKKDIKKLAPTFKVQYLRGELSPEQVKAEGLDGLDYHYSVFLKNPTWIAEAKNLGLVTNVWTVNDEAVFKQLSEMGVDFVTTNIPDVLSKK